MYIHPSPWLSNPRAPNDEVLQSSSTLKKLKLQTAKSKLPHLAAERSGWMEVERKVQERNNKLLASKLLRTQHQLQTGCTKPALLSRMSHCPYTLTRCIVSAGTNSDTHLRQACRQRSPTWSAGPVAKHENHLGEVPIIAL